jgi:GntR family transcriptional regulator, histidine utilization repressor
MARALGWQDVHDEALRRIRARDWAPGARIPDEADLAAELGCARVTVNRALRELARTGWLERRRKGGTRVPMTPVRKATFDIAILRHEVEARGARHGYRLLSDTDEPAPEALRAALGPETPAVLRHVRALHLADDRPCCLEDRWLNPALLPPGTGFAAMSANEWLVRNLAYTRGTLAIGAVAADAELEDVLACAPGAALLRVERTTFAERAPITQVALTHAPGHRMETST